MRSATLLTQLAIWTGATNAFYPYVPRWKHEQEDAEVAVSARAIQPSSGLRLGVRRRRRQQSGVSVASEASRLASRYYQKKRGNNFDIMTSTESGEAMTAGVDQDGTDYSYFVQVEMGSKGKKLYMLIDTGAGSSWLMSPDCSTDACKSHNSFGPSDSSTFEQGSKPFSVSYGTGKVEGKVATDTIGLAGMSFKYEFGSATSTSDNFEDYAFDGILGLSTGSGANENFLKTAAEANELKDDIFAVALDRASDGVNSGEISFGKTNDNMYTGDIVYQALTGDDEWSVKLDDMGYDGKSAGVGMPAYIDTGTSFIFGAPDAVKKILSLVPGSSSADGLSYQVPCDTDKSLTFTFSGKDFEISPLDWISPQTSGGKCTANLYGMEVVDGAWLLGDTFLKNVYAVFDAGQKRIGFAARAEGQSSTPSSTAPATGTATSATSTGTGSPTRPTPTSGMSALPDTESKSRGPLGLGKESASSTSTGSDSKETGKGDDKENDSSKLYVGMNGGVVFLTFIALLA